MPKSISKNDSLPPPEVTRTERNPENESEAILFIRSGDRFRHLPELAELFKIVSCHSLQLLINRVAVDSKVIIAHCFLKLLKLIENNIRHTSTKLTWEGAL